MAISYNIFTEPRKGVVSHTAISKLLAEEILVHQWIGLVCNEMIPASVQAIPAMIKWPGSGEPHETGYALAHGNTVWNVLQNDIVRARRFADGMQFLQSHPSFSLEYLADALAWNTNGAPKNFVDIGGSRGYISIALAQRYPGLKCYVQDTPETLQGALAPNGLEDRVQFSVHNFFAAQTIKDADVYFMRSILHDWSDKYALEIIRNLIPALKVGAKVIVNEVCLPEPNTIPAYHDQLLRGYDLAMFQQFNSPERDAADWKALFHTADNRFKLARIVSLPGSILSVIEFVWEAGDL
ncbi:hypothetical protein N0V90_004051 [Kalmusia sp. IMI 367209]|nr:hypothetical protein N0V90_004051 [Kalmusia sp. IMI 367209]